MLKCITFIPPYFGLQRTRQVLLLWGVNCDIRSESIMEITEIFRIQYKLSSVNSTCGIRLISTKIIFNLSV